MNGGSKSKPGPAAAAADGLSVVVPIYNEASNLPALHERLAGFAERLARERRIAAEIIYVNDGSRDNTVEVVRQLPAGNFGVQLISLSRNFGKEAALLAGLDHARHGAVLFMDGDGQHPPELADKLVALWRDEGYDVVYTAKASRANESASRRLAIRFFYRLLNWGVRNPIPEDASDFRLLSPRAVSALKQLPERNRFFKGLSSWIGFRQMRVPYEPAQRTHGRSKWNLRASVGLSIEGITAFSTAPLRLASLLGVALSVTALFFGGWIIFETLFYGKDVAGYPSIIVGIMVIGGVQLLMIGIMGEYIAKILSELKGRPVYFIAEHEIREGAAAAKRDPREAAE
ncbi:MAG TPA: glycosyltransferase family 2 protein [Xanthobacteraceae bacterium]|nr:glycosyltransferase family 2 protein [Xanthobacteraceae bacterium]